jgi:hypothetical protein
MADLQSNPQRQQLLLAFALVYVLLALYYTAHPKEVLTYYHNSEITYFKAQDMARGDHQWGMFFDGPDLRTPRYEFHMPEGPTYMMALWLMSGLPIEAYRALPILISTVCHLLLLMALFKRYQHKLSLPFVTFAFGWVAYQPMIVAWSKAVDDGSYNFSLMALLLCTSLYASKKRWIWYLILGFALGSQEFYRQPMMLLLLWFSEWLIRQDHEENDLQRLVKSFLWASITGVGVVSGLLFHILQLALVWNSWEDAWNEMAGAALGRASIKNELNPEFFYEKLQDQKNANAPLEWVRFSTMIKCWVSVFWYDQGRKYVWPILFMAGIVASYWPILSQKKWPWNRNQTLTILAFCFLIPNIWTLMMPNHASVHFYYIARDYSGWCWAVLLILLECYRKR